jgi:hypothetical protein
MSNGDVRRITRDIDIGGVTAFTQGEEVVVETTMPHPEQPQFKHIVCSRLTGKRYQLRDEDLEISQKAPAPAQYFAPGDAFQQGVVASPSDAQYSSPSDAFGGPYAGAPAYQSPLEQVRPRPSGAEETQTRLMKFSGGIAGLGLLIIITTFMPWLSLMGFDLGSGWNAMLHGSNSGGFAIYVHGEGVMFFTGIWSIIIGLAVITGAVLFFYKRNIVGGWVSNIAGVCGVLFSSLTIMTIVTHGVSAGFGLWLFNLTSLGAVILSSFAIKAFR